MKRSLAILFSILGIYASVRSVPVVFAEDASASGQSSSGYYDEYDPSSDYVQSSSYVALTSSSVSSEASVSSDFGYCWPEQYSIMKSEPNDDGGTDVTYETVSGTTRTVTLIYDNHVYGNGMLLTVAGSEYTNYSWDMAACIFIKMDKYVTEEHSTIWGDSSEYEESNVFWQAYRQYAPDGPLVSLWWDRNTNGFEQVNDPVMGWHRVREWSLYYPDNDVLKEGYEKQWVYDYAEGVLERIIKDSYGGNGLHTQTIEEVGSSSSEGGSSSDGW